MKRIRKQTQKQKHFVSKNKSKLAVFIGKPGAGKTTLINTAFKDRTFVDIWTFAKKFYSFSWGGGRN